MVGSKIIQAGYRPVRIRPNSKAPADSGWNTMDITEPQVSTWRGGFGVQGDHHPGVDLDLHDVELADRMEAAILGFLGAAPVRFSHRPASRLLVYRTDEPFGKMVLRLNGEIKQEVEILGSGRQYIVYGTHPEGTDYSWKGRNLWDIPQAQLNVLDKNQALALLEYLAEEFGGRIIGSGEKVEEMTPEALAALRAPSMEHVVDFLADFPNNDETLMRAFPNAASERDAWVQIALAVYGAGGKGLETEFVEWTMRWEDGIADALDAANVFLSCYDTRLGWDVLQGILDRLNPIPAEDEFEAELGGPEPVVYPDVATYSDDWCAQMLLDHYGVRETMAKVSKRWRVWDGKQWSYSADQGSSNYHVALRKKLRLLSNALLARANDAQGDEGKAIRAAALRLVSRAGIESMQILVGADLIRDEQEFDQDANVLNTPAGLVNLNDGTIRPSVPEDMVTRNTGVAPTPGYVPAAAPAWDGFLEHLTGGDAELESFLQRWCGYSLTGHMSEKKLLFIHGANSNTGKSTFVNAVKHAVGLYGRSVGVNQFLGKAGNTDALAQLPGVRMASATEASSGEQWDDAMLKAVTGGDSIEARRLYGSFFSFDPQFKVMVAGNHPPELKAVDTAMLKRVMIMPMNQIVKMEQMDRLLGEKLKAEASSILAWMIEGAKVWYQEGLNPPEAVTFATQEYADDADILGLWLYERCITDGDSERFAVSSDLYQDWRDWNLSRGNTDFENQTGLSSALKAMANEDLQVRYTRRRAGRGFEGMSVRSRKVEDVQL